MHACIYINDAMYISMGHTLSYYTCNVTRGKGAKERKERREMIFYPETKERGGGVIHYYSVT